MRPSHRLESLATDLEKALDRLTKLLKGLTFYPPGHPALQAAATDATRHLQALLKRHGPLNYRITEGAFGVADKLLTTNHSQVQNLAIKLQNLGVTELSFLPTMTSLDLLVFSEELSQQVQSEATADDFRSRLAGRKIESILIGTATQGQQTEAEQVQDLLEELKGPLIDETYQQLLLQLEAQSAHFFRSKGLSGYLAVFTLLECHGKDSTRPDCQQQSAQKVLERLLTAPVRRKLANAIGDPQLKASQRRVLTKLAINLERKIAPQLLQRLYAERDALVRRQYDEILAQMGEAIFDLLAADLHSPTWHVVRNVANILGKTGLESAVPLLNRIIDHPEARVRRAAIRALGAIGGDTVIYPLFHLAQDHDSSLHQPAIRALGGLKNPQAVPSLVELLKYSGTISKQQELKIEIIHALAATEAPQAIIPLLKMARQHNLLNRKGTELLRAEAILALGQIGSYRLLPILERLPRKNKEPVSRALQIATSQLRKPKAAA